MKTRRVPAVLALLLTANCGHQHNVHPMTTASPQHDGPCLISLTKDCGAKGDLQDGEFIELDGVGRTDHPGILRRHPKSKSPKFLPTDCRSGRGCKGRVDKLICVEPDSCGKIVGFINEDIVLIDVPSITVNTNSGFGRYRYGTDDSAALDRCMTALDQLRLAGADSCMEVEAESFAIGPDPLPKDAKVVHSTIK